MGLRLHNTLTRTKQVFDPIDPGNVRMYVCGPTVYDFAHIGNARPLIVFDVLFRLLRHLYGPEHVTYVRNITDVDDKINARAARDYPELPLNEAIREVTTRTEAQFHADVAALGCLPPTIEPRATDHIAEMRAMIETLIEKGYAYVEQGHVLFHVAAMPDYGKLSNRSLDDMIAGARVEVAPYKRDPMDFVLWKPSRQEAGSEATGKVTGGEPGWPSPGGIDSPGRPGWHLECSAMADKWLWDAARPRLSEAGLARPHEFDIHGGGIDLVFPHHENEIAQSRCAHGTEVMANFWMHNGFLQVEGEKMAKSAGNFVTVRELLETEKFGGRRWHGEIVRLAMLKSHYRQPIDWTVSALEEATKTLETWYLATDSVALERAPTEIADVGVVSALEDDLNTAQAMARLHQIFSEIKGPTSGLANIELQRKFRASARLLGLMMTNAEAFLTRQVRSSQLRKSDIESFIAARAAARSAKNWAEADRIRDELDAMGIALKDSRNPESGELETTWEVKR